MFKKYRILRGFTQEKLSEITKIDNRNLQRIENNEHLPSILTFAKLVLALNISGDDVIKYLKNISKQ